MKQLSLADQVVRLNAEIKALKDPPRSPEEIDKRISQEKAFFATMNAAKGAVTASNLYTEKVIGSIYDLPYRRALLDFLLSTFKKDSLLIEGTYSMWETYRKEGL